MQRLTFGDKDIENVLAKMSPKAIDELAFGVVLVDRNGTILEYNAAEGDITGRDPKAVLQRNFFTEVAPCTNRKEFYGKFLEGVKGGRLNVLFDYTFDYKMKPTHVKVHMLSGPRRDQFYILVKRV